MSLSWLPAGRPQTSTEYSSHYEIIDSDLSSYILSMDAKAWQLYLRGISICPFCNSEVTVTSSCCRRFAQLRQKLSDQAGARSKDNKSKGKTLSVVEKEKQKNKDHLANRSVWFSTAFESCL